MNNLKTNKQTNKKSDISLLRIAATLAVVFLHTNNTLSNNLSQFSLTENQTVFFTVNNVLMNWAVPVFLMITGALLLDSNRKITENICIKKYAKRIVLALFVFGVPFSILEILLNTKTIRIETLFEAILNVINGNSWSHLWYLYSLIGLYLILPILKSFVDNSSEKTLFYSLSILFLFDFVTKWIDKIAGTTIAFEIPIAGFIVFYALAGRYFTIKKPFFLKEKRICGGLMIIEVIAMILFSIFFYPQSKEFLSYNSPLIACLSITIFCFFSGFTVKNPKILWKADRLCFGVYLIHPVFINFVYKFVKFTPIKFGSAYPIATFGFWLFFIITSFVGAWIMYQIPVLKKYIL